MNHHTLLDNHTILCDSLHLIPRKNETQWLCNFWRVLRNGDAHILNPWAFPSEEKYAELVQSKQPDYVSHHRSCCRSLNVESCAVKPIQTWRDLHILPLDDHPNNLKASPPSAFRHAIFYIPPVFTHVFHL